MGKNRRQRERKRTEKETGSCSGGGMIMIDVLGKDLLQDILSRLPASSFASAACVNRCWNSVCGRILCRPKLSSALSLNPDLKVAVKEVFDKVLSVPICPHFAIAWITHPFDLQLAHLYITKKLGSTCPVISCKSRGIMGKDTLTNEFKELQCKFDDNFQIDDIFQYPESGISLVVGFVPGLKVDALPLLQTAQDPQVLMIDDFIMDIREYTASVSGSTSPTGMIMFGGPETDMKHVLDKMDYAMHPETFIVGGECCHFLCRAQNGAGNCMDQKGVGVALLFMQDRNRHRGFGDIQFHAATSFGMVPIGPLFKAAAVKERSEESWLSATNEERREYIDGRSMLNDIEEELGDPSSVLYIGVTKRRKCSVGWEKPRWITSLAFHEVIEGDETYLFVQGGGIKTGDYFRFYSSDRSTALSSCRRVSKDLERLKQDMEASTDKKQAFGGIIFTCCGRGESFFGETNVDGSPLLENFPGIPLAGAFCGGEISRGSSSLYCKEGQEPSSARCCLHAFSTVYLVLSHTPAQLEN